MDDARSSQPLARLTAASRRKGHPINRRAGGLSGPWLALGVASWRGLSRQGIVTLASTLGGVSVAVGVSFQPRTLHSRRFAVAINTINIIVTVGRLAFKEVGLWRFRGGPRGDRSTEDGLAFEDVVHPSPPNVGRWRRSSSTFLDRR